MWEGAESDVAYLRTRYLGKREMRDVTAIFAVSGLKMNRGLMSVAVSSIFSTQCWRSALVCLWY